MYPHEHEHEHFDATINKYAQALEKYPAPFTDAEVDKAVAQLVDQHVAENDNKKVKQLLLHCVDLTTLTVTDNDERVMHLAKQVNLLDEKHPELENVASICVYPCFAEIVRATLEVEAVGITCVSGAFPSSQTFSEVKIAETALALRDGATEIDIVLPVGKFLAGDYEAVCDEIGELKAVCADKTMKVILETGALKTADLIHKASILSMLSGADFIKTSTGKIDISATPQAAYVMCHAIKEYYKETGVKVGFKAAGGMKTVRDALVYYTIVKEVLGEEWLNNKLFRLGTSRLANLLLSDILEEEIKLF